MGSKEGVLKIAAKRIGVTIEEYTDKTKNGYKWCYKCKTWKKIRWFGKDTGRPSGIAAACGTCRRSQVKNKVSKTARKRKEKLGLKYCRGCKSWQAAEKIERGACNPCKAKYARKRYKEDKKHRHERIQHARSRARGTDKIPFELCEKLTTLFNGCCVYCGDIATGWDHVIPISKGGGSNGGNIVPACRVCNSSKKNNNVFTWLAKVGKVPHILFESVVSINH